METERHVRLSRSSGNQVVRIPKEFELPGSEAVIRKEGDRLVIEPVKTSNLFEWLATLEPIEDDFPDVDEGLLPARDVNL